ncbi:MAG: 3-phosphoshikimate 1-carboxyvinyltransferase [Verrucomicrobiales bacterium]|nr:3-phosphoshikimate 1-carboxyvinyltransferase [Verrucomicrobiales bacterium]
MLPPLIEIVPPAAPLRGTITVPGSKSITNRALVLAALSSGVTRVTGALWSEDTQVMVECLGQLGYAVEVGQDPAESANRRLQITGQGGSVPAGGTADRPLELFVGNAGTAARFLAAMVCLGRGWYRLHGVPRMHERPQAELFDALRRLGYRVESVSNRLPVLIEGRGPRPGLVEVSVRESSQFASALLLSARVGGWDVRVEGDNDEELPYVDMTRHLVRAFPWQGGTFAVEPDASSGSYFWAAGESPGDVTVRDWPDSGWQADAAFPRFLPLPPRVSRATDLADSIMTAIVLAPFASRAVTFTELGRLRVQECERVVALRTELTKCGARVEEAGDTLTVFPGGALHGAEIETYHDHRMAMCFAVFGLRVPGIRLRDPGCVRKTFPNFFAKLAAPGPEGLGVRILDARKGEPLPETAWLADGP